VNELILKRWWWGTIQLVLRALAFVCFGFYAWKLCQKVHYSTTLSFQNIKFKSIFLVACLSSQSIFSFQQIWSNFFQKFYLTILKRICYINLWNASISRYVNTDFSQSSFIHGQTYVALSRAHEWADIKKYTGQEAILLFKNVVWRSILYSVN
jgi:glucan phosphoethanolaminetransferase (alkaline phosphatase superfamily)